MIIVRTIEELGSYRGRLKGTVGFVPTMGALHQGHLSLVERSKEDSAHTIVSIYVNPTQFNNRDDLANYPDTLDQDIEKLELLGVDCLFMPSYGSLYPDNFAFQVEEKNFSTKLCGAHREGHFTGVLTVVLKLFNLVKPDKAFFGEKDFQQLTLIQQMARAFFLEVEVIGCPTIREKDGLAMSSRNLNLHACDRRRSPVFYKILNCASKDVDAAAQLESAGFDVDYVTTIDSRRYGAVTLGASGRTVRLIDNISLESR